jgi:uncharacterized membrane protein YheB (UPF0754 family)
MKNNNMVRTSVQIPETLFDEFKIECIKNKFSIQKLTERSMYLYMTDDNFKKNIHNVLDTFFTGSIEN